MRYFYRRTDASGGTIYESRTFPSALGEEITEEEYNAAVAEIEAEIEAEIAERAEAAAQERVDRIEELESRVEELEAENAELARSNLTLQKNNAALLRRTGVNM